MGTYFPLALILDGNIEHKATKFSMLNCGFTENEILEWEPTEVK